MLHAPVRMMGVVFAVGLLGAALAWAEEPAAKPQETGAKASKPPAASRATTAKGKATTTKTTTTTKATTTKAKGTAGAGAAEEAAVLETTKGRMVLEFWSKDAPQTVVNFKKLARQGFFDGTGFHRVIKGFMIQGGDPKSKNPKAPDLGTGDPGYKIPDEFNARNHNPGVISMANSGTPNSAGSQFFLMHGAAPDLDGKYTAFGRVIEGMNVLNAIANTPVGPSATMGGEKSKPLEWTTLKSVRIVPRSSLAKAPAASTGSLKARAAGKSGAGVKTAAGTRSGTAPTASQTAAAPATQAAAPEKASADTTQHKH